MRGVAVVSPAVLHSHAGFEPASRDRRNSANEPGSKEVRVSSSDVAVRKNAAEVEEKRDAEKLRYSL
jgi:hypothetical protein